MHHLPFLPRIAGINSKDTRLLNLKALKPRVACTGLRTFQRNRPVALLLATHHFTGSVLAAKDSPTSSSNRLPVVLLATIGDELTWFFGSRSREAWSSRTMQRKKPNLTLFHILSSNYSVVAKLRETCPRYHSSSFVLRLNLS